MTSFRITVSTLKHLRYCPREAFFAHNKVIKDNDLMRLSRALHAKLNSGVSTGTIAFTTMQDGLDCLRSPEEILQSGVWDFLYRGGYRTGSGSVIANDDPAYTLAFTRTTSSISYCISGRPDLVIDRDGDEQTFLIVDYKLAQSISSYGTTAEYAAIAYSWLMFQHKPTLECAKVLFLGFKRGSRTPYGAAELDYSRSSIEQHMSVVDAKVEDFYRKIGAGCEPEAKTGAGCSTCVAAQEHCEEGRLHSQRTRLS